MPKIKLRYFGDPDGDICELEEVRYLFDFPYRIIVVDGQAVNSYDQLVQIVSQKKFSGQEFIEIVQVPNIEGG
jgi:hypothetical protein